MVDPSGLMPAFHKETRFIGARPSPVGYYIDGHFVTLMGAAMRLMGRGSSGDGIRAAMEAGMAAKQSQLQWVRLHSAIANALGVREIVKTVLNVTDGSVASVDRIFFEAGDDLRGLFAYNGEFNYSDGEPPCKGCSVGPFERDAKGTVEMGKLTQDDIKDAAEKASKVGTGLEIIDALDKSLGRNTRLFGEVGRIGGWMANGGQVVYDGVEYHQGKISGYRFTFRLGITFTSAIVGAEVGAAIGGPYGFAAGTVIGLGGAVTEGAWDVVKPQIQGGFNQFINTIKSSIRH